MATGDKKRLNPWFSMWTKPRATIAQLVQQESDNVTYLLPVLIGISLYAGELTVGSPAEWQHSWIHMLVYGLLYGAIGFCISANVIYCTGKWLGGKGEKDDVLAAVAWSYVPKMWFALLYVLLLIVLFSTFSNSLVSTDKQRVDEAVNIIRIFDGGTFVLDAVTSVWTIILLLKSLSQVQGFSVCKAVGNILLALFLPVGVILVVMLTIGMLFFGGAMFFAQPPAGM